MQQYTQQSSSIVDDQCISSLATAQSLTIPSETLTALVQAQGGKVRFRVNAGPTASAGGIIYDGNWHEFIGKLALLQFIAEDSGAEIYVLYGRG